jgi:DNA segregation ATPase FtsK/SpoIIIE, S-DNA-T family
MTIYYTPDEWPTVRTALTQSGVTNYQRMRLDLNNPAAGWQPLADNTVENEVKLINRLLKEHKIDAAIDRNAILDPGQSFLVYGIKLGPGTRIMAIEQRLREIGEAIGTLRRKATPVRLRTMPLGLELPHPNQAPLLLTDAALRLPVHTSALGRSFDYAGSRNETVDFTTAAHVLIAGTTGSGKSTLLTSMLISLCANTSPADLQLILVDLKNEDLVPFAGLPHVRMFANSPERAETALNWMHAEKDNRVEGGRQRYQRWVLVIDELAEMTHLAGGQSELGSVLSIGRSKSLNVLAATQKPTSAVVGSVAKGNFTTRLVGRVLSADDSRVASGQPAVGAHLLPGNGSFLRVDGPEVRRLQGYYLTHDDIDHHVERICARWQQQAPLLKA